jgi:DNA-binding NtrC family response regulator
MAHSGCVLVVEPDEAALTNTVWEVRQAGHHVIGVSSFDEARRQLSLNPVDVLVSQARLGMFNGLHLAHMARSHNPRACALILNEELDATLERDVTALGGMLVPGRISSDALASLVTLVKGASDANEVGNPRPA